MRNVERYIAPLVIGCITVIIGASVVVGLLVTRAPSPATITPSPTDETPSLKLTKFVDNIAAPVGAVSSKSIGDLLFVVSRDGKIVVVRADGQKERTPLLDISDRVKSSGEMGLLGLVFDPDYAKNGYFYVNYVDNTQTTRISRFQADQSRVVADPKSEKYLISIKQPYKNHNGGDLHFGRDGFLYIALGDGGSAGDPENRAQRLDNLLGKILRIDVRGGDPYGIPESNPFKNTAGARPEIWAYGLRNPWRFSFDRTSHDMYIADVGQAEMEEVNVQSASSKGGENYGWRCYEGTRPYNTDDCRAEKDYTPPVLAYPRVEPKCSITGGFVYRGTKIPSLRGKYLYGDFCSGEIFAATHERSVWKSERLFKTRLKIASFGEAVSGELYVVDLASEAIYVLES